MAYILYDQGKKVGEVTDFVQEQNSAVYKTVLGKTVLSTPANDGCTFTSPKPVNRKTELKIIVEGNTEYKLQIISVKQHTQVIAKIIQKNPLNKI